jgi:hypothetical protein
MVPMDGKTDLIQMEEELELLAEMDPAEMADRAASLTDSLARALDALDEENQP